MSKFSYVYVLRSQKDGDLYPGHTSDLRRRLDEHRSRAVRSTKNRLPVALIYYGACLSQADATGRGQYLKTAWGKRYLKSRLASYLTG